MWIIPKNLHTSHYVPDTAVLISDLSELSQACEQSLLVRSKPMLAQTWLRKLKRDYWTRPLFGRILKPFLGKAFTERWTSSQAAFLVNPSQRPEKEKEMKTPVTFSHISREELSLLDLPLFSLRTSKESSLVNLQQVKKMKKERPFCYMSLENWKDWVTEQRRAYLVRMKLGPPTRGKESLSWATARVGMSNAPAGGGDPLKKEWRFRLENQVQISFPQEEEKNKNYGSPQELLPTPTATEHKYRLKRTSQSSQNLNAVHKGKLNPRWVEALMGIPIGWTMVTCANPYVIEQMSSDSLVTEFCQQPQKELSEPCGKNWATPTTSQLQLNESLDSYLRRSKKRILKGQVPFPTQLTFEVEAEEKGIIIKDELNLNIFLIYAMETEDPFMRLDGLDSCIVGLNASNKLVYSYSMLIDHFAKEEGEEEALAHISHNILSIEREDSFQILYDLK